MVPAPRTLYLAIYNAASAVGWTAILALTLAHILGLDGDSPQVDNSKGWASYAPSSMNLIRLRSATTFHHVNHITTLVQTCAVLEVVHVLLGWVRSPLVTTSMQVSSRLFLVWGIVAQYPQVHDHFLYTSMVLAWSITEVIRYSYYALNLFKRESSIITYLRYTTFFILYPLGASSEAFLIRASLPKESDAWSRTDYVRVGLFIAWWPGLYIMYTHMILQRRKVLGTTLKVKVT